MLENTLERIASALESIAGSLAKQPVQLELAPESIPAPLPAPVPVPAPAPAPVPAPAPAPAPAPVVEAPTPAFMVDTGLPFNDEKGLMEYCMGKYKALGPTRGGMIQTILVNMGLSNIKGLKPEQYASFYEQVEKL